MIGPKDGMLLEIVWTPELREELVRWLIVEGQQPFPTRKDFSKIGASRYLAKCNEMAARAILILGAKLEHHAIKPLDADIAALKPPRPELAQPALPMPTRTTPP